MCSTPWLNLSGAYGSSHVGLRVRSQITSQIPMHKNPLSSSAIPKLLTDEPLGFSTLER
jgi:hypothetical protein